MLLSRVLKRMKKSFIVLLHIGFWLCYFILIAIMLAVYYRSSVNAGNQESRILNALKSLLLFAFIPSFISYWSYYFLLFPKYLQHKKSTSFNHPRRAYFCRGSPDRVYPDPVFDRIRLYDRHG